MVALSKKSFELNIETFNGVLARESKLDPRAKKTEAKNGKSV
jgi:hypothetical protein